MSRFFQSFREQIKLNGLSILVLRVTVGLGFAAHGYAKFSRGPEKFAVVLNSLGVPHPGLMSWVTTVLELVGGIALIVGAFVIPITIPLAVVMLTAFFTVHLRYGFSSVRLQAVTSSGAQFGPVGYELNLLYLSALLAIALNGAGGISIDGLLHRRKTRARRASKF